MIDNGPPDFSKFSDLLLDMICVVDDQGRFLYISSACESLLGYSPQELLGNNMIDFVYPKDRERTLVAAQNVMAGHPHLHFENRYQRKDGGITHFMWSARWLDAQRVRIAVARDITAVKRADNLQKILYRLSEGIHAAETFDVLYSEIYPAVSELIPTKNFYIAIYNQHENTVSFPFIAGDEHHNNELKVHQLESATPLAEIIHRGRPLKLKCDPKKHRGTIDHESSDLAFGPWLGVPINNGTIVLGALVAEHPNGTAYSQDDEEILQLVSNQLATAIDRKETQARLSYLALHDALTGLPNRFLFFDRFDMALKLAHRNQLHLALLYLDLDDFKRINDKYGHQTGDQLLCEVARRLEYCVRESDTVGRIGGDEFTILLGNVADPEEGIKVVMSKLEAVFRTPFPTSDTRVGISTSVGIAIYPEHGRDKESLLRYADAHMYANKRVENKVAGGSTPT